MSSIRKIQYLPLTHPRATLRFLNKLDAAGVMSILDLEDSAQDPFDEEKTKILKIKARNNFEELINSKAWVGDEFNNPIYVRVNSVTSEFFEDDVHTVARISASGFPVSGIFLPMVESYADIELLSNLLESCSSGNEVKNLIEVVPMIETTAGMSGLEDILTLDEGKGLFEKVHYGHFDFCLDANLWPFPDPNQALFWELVEPLIEVTLKHRKTYIHTPFPFPNDVVLFWQASRYMRQLFPSGDIWACTLNSELSLSNEPDNLSVLDICHDELLPETMKSEAEAIRHSFLAGRANRRSFGVSSQRFIPPHQFFAAEEYLRAIGGD